MDAIIGNRGFVGGHLVNQHDFAAQYNTSNIDQALGHSFSKVVCAAAPGSMFEANKFPDRDKKNVDQLIDQLSQITAKQFVLVSSIAVLEDFAGKDDEFTDRFQTELAYGRHRRELEVFCSENFSSCLILRLPALFGHKLKKNFIFDLLNPVPSMLNKKSYDELVKILPSILAKLLVKVYLWNDEINMYQVDRSILKNSENKDELEEALAKTDYSSVQFTNPNTTFQYYNIENLWSDIEMAQNNNIKLLHLATEPLAAERIHMELTGKTMPDTQARIHHENMYSSYGKLWKGSGPYLADGNSILTQLKTFFENEKKFS